MTQRNAQNDANRKYTKKLMVDIGYKYVLVRARIIEPYGSPIPQPSTKEIKLINAPSHIQQMGLSSYKVTLTLLFEDKNSYAEYVSYAGWGHKFYDEKGSVYVGALESIKTKSVEANRRYKVEVSLILIKKSRYDKEGVEIHFQDADKSADYYEDLEDLANLGIIDAYEENGDPVLYFNISSRLSRAEFATMIMRTKRILEQMLRE